MKEPIEWIIDELIYSDYKTFERIIKDKWDKVQAYEARDRYGLLYKVYTNSVDRAIKIVGLTAFRDIDFIVWLLSDENCSGRFVLGLKSNQYDVAMLLEAIGSLNIPLLRNLQKLETTSGLIIALASKDWKDDDYINIAIYLSSIDYSLSDVFAQTILCDETAKNCKFLLDILFVLSQVDKGLQEITWKQIYDYTKANEDRDCNLYRMFRLAMALNIQTSYNDL